MTTNDRTSSIDAVRQLNASDPRTVYGPGCEKSLARYCPDCNCQSCRDWRKARGYR